MSSSDGSATSREEDEDDASAADSLCLVTSDEDDVPSLTSSSVAGSEDGSQHGSDDEDQSASAGAPRRHGPRECVPPEWVPRGWPAISRRVRWRILLPCAGADAVTRALGEMNVPHVVVGAWEKDAQTAKILTKWFANRSDRGSIHSGDAQGDITCVKAQDVPDAEGLIAGPPCPPWSSSGKGLSWKDDRAQPSNVLFRWLRHLCRRKRPLRFFILENVRGILGKRGVGYLVKLRAALPQDWNLAALVMDSRCCAQTRPRAYLVGWKASRTLSPSEATKVIRGKLLHLPRRHLSSILLDMPNEDPKEVLTAQQARNFRKWMRKVQSKLNDKRQKGVVACFEVDRNPDKSRGTLRTDDLMMTLRASGNPIWLVSLGEGRRGPSVSRLLALEERCLLQGFDMSTMPDSVSARRVRHAMGNAMSVPVVGSVLGATLLQLDEEERRRQRQESSEEGDSRSSADDSDSSADNSDSIDDSDSSADDSG